MTRLDPRAALRDRARITHILILWAGQDAIKGAVPGGPEVADRGVSPTTLLGRNQSAFSLFASRESPRAEKKLMHTNTTHSSKNCFRSKVWN